MVLASPNSLLGWEHVCFGQLQMQLGKEILSKLKNKELSILVFFSVCWLLVIVLVVDNCCQGGWLNVKLVFSITLCQEQQWYSRVIYITSHERHNFAIFRAAICKKKSTRESTATPPDHPLHHAARSQSPSGLSQSSGLEIQSSGNKFFFQTSLEKAWRSFLYIFEEIGKSMWE